MVVMIAAYDLPRHRPACACVCVCFFNILKVQVPFAFACGSALLLLWGF